MPYDPTLYRDTAAYYTPGRPPYSRALVPTLRAEVGLDGSGRLLDVGCGPGPLAIALARSFSETIGLEPDAAMLAEAARRAAEAGVDTIRWVQALAEDIPALGLGQFKLVTFGQSFHWTDRERVAEAVYDMLEPGGAIALIGHQHDGRPQPSGPGEPRIPHDARRAILQRDQGPRRRAGQGFAALPADNHTAALARTRFGAPEQIYCVGRPDIVQDVDGVLANYLSTSFAAPHLFGARLQDFVADVRAALAEHSPSGLFWDWPGDTAILLARKPR
jgi:SAM-dependent methyltransferase